jgi:hypothetical protein
MTKTKHSRAHTVKKMVFITAWLIEDPDAYIDKTNSDIEKEISKEIGPIPYVAQIEKVTVLELSTIKRFPSQP